MKLRHYEFICLIITIILGYEFLILNHLLIKPSLTNFVAVNLYPKHKINLSPIPGYPISYTLGWAGFITMCITNFYILRKRFGFMKSFGKASGWLDFHIFCGILGPIFIVFHSNFRVNGLVAISFWSMIISAGSGVFGRYFYIQVLGKKTDKIKYSDKLEAHFREAFSKNWAHEKIDLAINRYKIDMGVETKASLGGVLRSIYHDLAFWHSTPAKELGLSDKADKLLTEYALEKRRILYYDHFSKLLGYWHAFHLPFAIFMYIVAIIHIVVALLLGVKH